jgi:F420-dependent oxidoreductase-like protein
MKIGIMLGATPGDDTSLEGLIGAAKQIEAQGFASLWLAQIFGHDAITVAALIGRETQRIEIATAVVPSPPRHPSTMAQQALTAGSACGGRFSLGIGLSHQIVIENMLGLSYARPARQMREYLEVLAPLLRGQPVQHQGDVYRVALGLQVPDRQPVPLLVAALGPVMLAVAGRLADGTITWMTGPETLAGHVVPSLCAAAEAAGRPAPRIVAGLPVAVTDDERSARGKIGEILKMYGTLPSYRAMLDREGVEGAADIALVGDEKKVGAALDRLAESGVTDMMAAVAPIEKDTRARTLALLAARR